MTNRIVYLIEARFQGIDPPVDEDVEQLLLQCLAAVLVQVVELVVVFGLTQ